MGAVSALLGPVFGSATGAGRALLDCDAAVRAPSPLCRRIGFVQLAPGVGGSTTAARVATVLARRRTGMVLAVDASPGPRGLLPLLDAPGAGTDPGGATAAEVRSSLPRAPSGCYAVDLRPIAPARPGRLPAAGAWSATVGPIARFFDVIVTDWGLRHPAYDLEPVLSGSHVVCLVVPTEDTAAALLDSLRTRPATPPIVVAALGGDRTRPVGPGPRDSLRLAAELMRPTGGDRRDR